MSSRDPAQPAPPATWPAGAAGRVLVVLLALGLALRVLAVVSWWPTTILEDGYQTFAGSNPFADPQHPAGYALILGAIGEVTHEIAVPVLLQHLTGFASALLLGAATRRVTRSAWAGLVPAAVVLLDADGIFLEHSIMSESWLILTISVALYAAVRALDRPGDWRPWPLVAGAALSVAVAIRSAAFPLVVVALLALAIGYGRAHGRWRPAVAAAAVTALILVGFAGAGAGFGPRFAIAPSPGWYLYGRAAQFADCHRFVAPPGTTRLCQKIPPSRRPSGYYYMFTPGSPALRLFGAFGRDDAVIGGWARRALQAQPGDFLLTAWTYLRSYYVPGSLPGRLKSSTGLDPQLDFTYAGNVFYDAAIHDALVGFFGKFATHRHVSGLRVLRGWQVVFRFGATALFVATIFTVIGLLIGSRRSRTAVLLFGVGGLSLLLAPVLTGTYSGRYTVPMAGPLVAASAITVTELLRRRARH